MGQFDRQRCQVDGCDRTWERDPVLEVKCPNCGAEPGEKCSRPSGHDVWAPHGRFHAARDFAALDAGAYGNCPQGECPQALDDLDDPPDVIGGLDLEASAKETTQTRLPGTGR